MLFDARLSWPILVTIILCCFLPLLADLSIPLFDGALVRSIENIQAFLLLCFAIVSYLYMRPLQLENGKKQFWIWAVLWWILLFGRSTSWGRDYFPAVPKVDFRVISVILIGAVAFMLFSSHLRQEIVHKFKTVTLPLWSVLLTLAGLLISDDIEHSRFLSSVFLHDLAYKDLMEELYEFPLIIGLFVISFYVMKCDKQAIKMP